MSRNGRNWSQQDELVARALEAINTWGWFHAIQLGANREKLQRPDPVSHPHRQQAAKGDQPRTNDPAAIRRFFARSSK